VPVQGELVDEMKKMIELNLHSHCCVAHVESKFVQSSSKMKSKESFIERLFPFRSLFKSVTRKLLKN
jgi:hypothetical protein